MPAVCGVAIDVPERMRPCVPVPTDADSRLTPGAAMSGLGALSLRGPAELKSAVLV